MNSRYQNVSEETLVHVMETGNGFAKNLDTVTLMDYDNEDAI
jgi:hypothetical protein